MNFLHITEKITAALLGFFFVCCLGFQLYALNKGFDITDEGYNLQLVQSQFVGISNTYFFESVQLFFGWLPSGLLVNRIVATLLLLGSSVFFVFASFRCFKLPFSASHLFFCLLCIPFALTLDPVTLSYNNLAATFTLLSSGCFFWLLSTEHKSSSLILSALLSGVFAAVVCMAKVTSGLVLSVSIPVLLLIITENKWKNTLLFCCGWVGYMLVHGMAYTPFDKQLSNILFAAGLFAKMDAHYERSALLNDVYIFAKDHFVLLLKFVAFFVLARMIPLKWAKVVLWCMAAGYCYYLFDQHELKLTGLILVLGSLLCVAFFVVQRFDQTILKTIGEQYKIIVCAGFLFAIPLMVVMGTNNVYYHNYIFAAIPLSVLCVLMLERGDVSWYKQVVMALIGGCIVFICYTKILFQPYRILPLAQQTEVSGIGMLTGIKLDPGTKLRYQHLQQTFSKYGFSKHNGLICLGKMQGLQYLLEASSPGGVMFSPTFRELYLENLALDTTSYAKPYFVLSDYRFVDSLNSDSGNWEHRFTRGLSTQSHQSIQWNLLDSVVFETAPLGRLFVYRGD